MSAPAQLAGGWRFLLRAGAFLHGISNASKQSHIRQQTSHREPQLSSISFVWVFLCANGTGCGWLRLADGLFVTRIEAPRFCPPPQLATVLKPFSLLVDGHGDDCVHLPSLCEVNYELSTLKRVDVCPCNSCILDMMCNKICMYI